MTITIVSGKGGSGKTTVAAQLFLSSEKGILIDADVEEPNVSLLLKGEEADLQWVTRNVPVIQEDLCIHCGRCARICRFHAILATPDQTIPMEALCHDCGACGLVCSAGAIVYEARLLGHIQNWNREDREYRSGTLEVGELSGVKIIGTLMDRSRDIPLRWIDGPPGTACTASAALDEADYAVVVADPTPFGLKDMQMVIELLLKRGIPFGVVVNKYDLGEGIIQDFCRNKNHFLLGEIPFRKEWAAQLAGGRIPDDGEWHGLFSELSRNILLKAREESYGRP